MRYGYDTYGWYSGQTLSGRSTDIVPPSVSGSPIAGQPWPNLAGEKWIMVNYVAPPTNPTKQQLNAAIYAQIDAIYAGIMKPRTQAMLANGDAATKTWVATQIALIEGVGGLRSQLLP